jgi:hypothetical protein
MLSLAAAFGRSQKNERAISELGIDPFFGSRRIDNDRKCPKMWPVTMASIPARIGPDGSHVSQDLHFSST